MSYRLYPKYKPNIVSHYSTKQSITSSYQKYFIISASFPYKSSANTSSIIRASPPPLFRPPLLPSGTSTLIKTPSRLWYFSLNSYIPASATKELPRKLCTSILLSTYCLLPSDLDVPAHNLKKLLNSFIIIFL